MQQLTKKRKSTYSDPEEVLKAHSPFVKAEDLKRSRLLKQLRSSVSAVIENTDNNLLRHRCLEDYLFIVWKAMEMETKVICDSPITQRLQEKDGPKNVTEMKELMHFVLGSVVDCICKVAGMLAYAGADVKQLLNYLIIAVIEGYPNLPDLTPLQDGDEITENIETNCKRIQEYFKTSKPSDLVFCDELEGFKIQEHLEAPLQHPPPQVTAHLT